jgi:hypothetical protein
MAGPLTGLTIRPGVDVFRVRSLVGPAARPAVADLLIGISEGLIADFSVFSTSFVSRSKPAARALEDWLLVRATLDRILGPILLLGLSRVTARGDKVGLDGTTSFEK